MNYIIQHSSGSASCSPEHHPEYDPLRTDMDTVTIEDKDILQYFSKSSDQTTTAPESLANRAAVINKLLMQSFTSSDMPIDDYADLIVGLLSELSDEDYEYYSDNPAYYQLVTVISTLKDPALNLLSDQIFKNLRDEDAVAILIDMLGKLRDESTLALRKQIILSALLDNSNAIRHASISALGHICEKDLIQAVDQALVREESPLLVSGLERLKTRLTRFGS